jgi:hypothetical protein
MSWARWAEPTRIRSEGPEPLTARMRRSLQAIPQSEK